jgi:hypothetical protein
MHLTLDAALGRRGGGGGGDGGGEWRGHARRYFNYFLALLPREHPLAKLLGAPLYGCVTRVCGLRGVSRASSFFLFLSFPFLSFLFSFLFSPLSCLALFSLFPFLLSIFFFFYPPAVGVRRWRSNWTGTTGPT